MGCQFSLPGCAWRENVSQRLRNVELRLFALDATQAELRNRVADLADPRSSEKTSSEDSSDDQLGDVRMEEQRGDIRPPTTPAPRRRRCVVTPELLAELHAMALNDLKVLLHINHQVASGPKAEVVARIVECLEYGRLPRCPKCHRSTLKQDAGLFRCPGYVSGTDYQPCGFVCCKNALTFQPFVWK